MDVKKGLSYVAFGFLFTLVNINLSFNGTTVNIMPDFVGWILLFLAFDQLGSYMEEKSYLKWISLIMIILTAVRWVLDVFMTEINIDILSTVSAIISAVYMFMLFGVLEKIARDYGSQRESTLHMVKILNLALYIAFALLGLLTLVTESMGIGTLTLIVGIAALVTAIITLVTLFKLKKEIGNQVEA